MNDLVYSNLNLKLFMDVTKTFILDNINENQITDLLNA